MHEITVASGRNNYYRSRYDIVFCFSFAALTCDKICCYIASAETKRDWLIHGHMALGKCNVSLGQQVNNCCPLRPAAYINKQNGGESCKFINSDFRAFCLKNYTIDKEDMLLKLKFNYSSKFWLF